MSYSVYNDVPLKIDGIEIGRGNVRIPQGRRAPVEIEITEIAHPEFHEAFVNRALKHLSIGQTDAPAS